jgi:hypothetical protein
MVSPAERQTHQKQANEADATAALLGDLQSFLTPLL